MYSNSCTGNWNYFRKLRVNGRLNRDAASMTLRVSCNSGVVFPRSIDEWNWKRLRRAWIRMRLRLLNGHADW